MLRYDNDIDDDYDVRTFSLALEAVGQTVHVLCVFLFFFPQIHFPPKCLLKHAHYISSVNIMGFFHTLVGSKWAAIDNSLYIEPNVLKEIKHSK